MGNLRRIDLENFNPLKRIKQQELILFAMSDCECSFMACYVFSWNSNFQWINMLMKCECQVQWNNRCEQLKRKH